MADTEMKKFLEGCIGAVEATRAEQHLLWQQYANEARKFDEDSNSNVTLKLIREKADFQYEHARPNPEAIGLKEIATIATNQLVKNLNNQQIRWPWNDKLSGFLPTVGYIGKNKKMPVCISVLTAEVNGYKLLFYHATSRYVDHDMIRKWLDDNMPVTAFEDNDPRTRLNHTDANNFANIVPRKHKEQTLVEG